MTIAGLILAGGLSRRMGREKAFVPFGGAPMIERMIGRIRGQVGDLAINGNGDPARFAAFGLPVVPDDVPETGPLGGVLAGLRRAETLPARPAFLASVPVDTPFLPLDVVARLSAAAAASPGIAIAASGERDHPVVALWPLSIADALAEWRRSARSQGVRGFLAAQGFTVVAYPLRHGEPDPFFNANTPEELTAAEGWLAASPHL